MTNLLCFAPSKKRLSFLLVFILLFSFASTITRPSYAQEDLLGIFENNLSLLSTEQTASLTTQEALSILDRLWEDHGFTVSDSFKKYTQAQGAYSADEIDKAQWLLLLHEIIYSDFHRWSLEDQHRFDLVLVAAGILKQPKHLLPSPGALSRDEIIAIAMENVVSNFDTPVAVKDFQYYAGCYATLYMDEATQAPLWEVTLRQPSPDFTVILSTRGEVYSMEMLTGMTTTTPSLRYLSELEETKGSFQYWSLEDKAWFSAILPALIEKEENQGNNVLPTLYAIASYQFTLPTKDVITKESALALSITTSQKTFGLPSHWVESLRSGLSFFYIDNIPIWRVAFWASTDIIAEFYGGVVEINALTGEILLVEKSGDTSETSIPYENRL